MLEMQICLVTGMSQQTLLLHSCNIAFLLSLTFSWYDLMCLHHCTEVLIQVYS